MDLNGQPSKNYNVKVKLINLKHRYDFGYDWYVQRLDTIYDGFMTDYEAQMLHDFENRWEVRRKLLNRVKDDLFPGYSWDNLQPKTLEVINNIVESLVGK